MREKALKYLNRNYLHNVDMLESIRRDICTIVYAEEDGVLIEVDEGTCAMLSCDSMELAQRLLKGNKYSLLVLHQTEMKEELCRKYGFRAGEECWQGVYTGREPLAQRPADIRLLDASYTDAIAAVYRVTGADYVRYLLDSGVMYGIFEEDKLAGFIGRHSEGSIGLLEVFPEYRRRGYAEALERYYVNLELKQGHAPYGQVFVGNMASRSLQEKLGMEFAERNICWLWKD